MIRLHRVVRMVERQVIFRADASRNITRAAFAEAILRIVVLIPRMTMARLPAVGGVLRAGVIAVFNVSDGAHMCILK